MNAEIEPPPWVQPRPRGADRGSAIDRDVRDTVWKRARYCCECCGEPLVRRDYQAHHRKLRSRGGEDSAANLVALHPLCHRRIHDHPAWATEHGWMVPTNDDPATVAVALHGAAWRLLTAAGGYLDAETGNDAA